MTEYITLKKDKIDNLHLEIISRYICEDTNAYSIQIKNFVGPINDYFNDYFNDYTKFIHGDILTVLLSFSADSKKNIITEDEFNKYLTNTIENVVNFTINEEIKNPGHPVLLPSIYNHKISYNKDLFKKIYDERIKNRGEP